MTAQEPRRRSAVDLEVDDTTEGATVAAVVRVALGEIPWSRAKDLCASGRVWIDEDRVRDPARRVRRGERVRVDPGARRLSRGTLVPEALAYVDRDVVVVRKPAGVLTVPYEKTDRDTLVDQTLAALRPAQRTSLGVVQRLDVTTSGLVVFARNLAAKRELQQQFRRHTIGRRYVAIVHGDARSATHETHLVQNRGDGLRGSWGTFRRAGAPPPASARRSITHVRVVERLAGATLVECRLETGRQHQIRIHLSEAGNPLAGERVYIRDYEGPRIEAPRPMLHAAYLAFDHPRTGERVELDEPPPEDFVELCARLRAP